MTKILTRKFNFCVRVPDELFLGVGISYGHQKLISNGISLIPRCAIPTKNHRKTRTVKTALDINWSNCCSFLHVQNLTSSSSFFFFETHTLTRNLEHLNTLFHRCISTESKKLENWICNINYSSVSQRLSIS